MMIQKLKIKKNNLIFIICLSFFVSSFSIQANSQTVQKFNPNNLLSDEEMLNYQSMTLKDIESFLAKKDGVLKNYLCRLPKQENENENGQTCQPYLDSEIRLSPNKENNDAEQIEKLQTFLKKYYPEVKETKIYDQITISAAIKFQEKYAEEVLAPWGLTKGTGYIGETTIKKINNLYCEELNQKLQEEAKEKWQCYFSSSAPAKKQGEQELSAAEVIYNLSQKYKINPKVILATLQKEQSLIDDSNPPQGLDHALNWAMGYGCLERGEWKEANKGFYNQVDGAYWQFRRWFNYSENYKHLHQKGVTYKANSLKALDNKIDVTPANYATAFLYRYTPHIYNGNYNFWNLWQEYFGPSDISQNQNQTKKYPDGTLIKSKNSPDIWLIENGEKRKLAVSSEQFNNLNFKWADIKEISEKDLTIYQNGKPIKYGPDNSLVRADSKVYFIEKGKKRWISSGLLFEKLGYKWSEVKKLPENDLENFLEGKPMLYPSGTLIQGNSTIVFLAEEGQRRKFTSANLFDILGYKWSDILKISNEELSFYSIGNPLLYPDGNLIRKKGDSTVWLIENSKKREITSGQLFNYLNYAWSKIIEISQEELNSYPTGKPALYQNGTLLRAKNSGTVYLIKDNQKKEIKSLEIFESRNYQWQDVIIVSEKEINLYSLGAFLKYPNGTLIKRERGAKIYVVKDGKGEWIKSAEEFKSAGYKWENVIELPDGEFEEYIK